MRRSGCGLTTMIAQTWPCSDSHQSSDLPWLLNVSNSATLAKGEDYQFSIKDCFKNKSSSCALSTIKKRVKLGCFRYFEHEKKSIDRNMSLLNGALRTDPCKNQGQLCIYLNPPHDTYLSGSTCSNQSSNLEFLDLQRNSGAGRDITDGF